VKSSLYAFGQQDATANDDQWSASVRTNDPLGNERTQRPLDAAAEANLRFINYTSRAHSENPIAFAEKLAAPALIINRLTEVGRQLLDMIGADGFCIGVPAVPA
jgi:hypothetical protein